MATTTANLGLTVWNLGTDPYSHTDLQNNWNLIDTFAGKSGKAIQNVNNLNAGTAGGPASPLNSGDMVMTNTAVSNWPAWSLLRWDGTRWELVGPVDVQSIVPVSNLFAGRVVLLSGASGNFAAWQLIRYDGSAWDYVGPFLVVNTGAGALNITGAQINGDVYLNSGNRGLILTDRSTTTKYRLYMNNGTLNFEVVT